LRDDLGEQGFAKFVEIPLGDFRVVEDTGMGLENLWFTVAQRHDDEHGLGFALRDEIVEDDVGAANFGPGVSVVTVAVQQIEDGISLLAARVVAGRGVNEKAAVVADYFGLVEMMMNLAMRNVGDFPGKTWRAGNVN